MFATLNLQFTALRTPLDGAIEPTGFPADGHSSGNSRALSFASLMAAEADIQPLQTPLGGEFLPEEGNGLPPLDPPKPADDCELLSDTEITVAADGPEAQIPALNIELAVPYAQAKVSLIDPAQVKLLPAGQMPVVATGETELTARTVDGMPDARLIERGLQAASTPATMTAASEAPVVQPLAESLLRDKAPQVMFEATRPVVVPVDDATIKPGDLSVGERLAVPGGTVSALETLQRLDTRVAATSSTHASTATHLPATISQFSVDPAQSRAEMLSDTINTPVRDAAWGDKLGERVLMLSGNQVKTAEIKLTPADLGPLRVRISVEEGAAHVSFHAQHAVTREAIEQALPRLREMLADSGLSLGQADVSEQGVADGKADREFLGGGKGGIAGEAQDDAAEVELAERRKTVTSNKLLDTFA